MTGPRSLHRPLSMPWGSCRLDVETRGTSLALAPPLPLCVCGEVYLTLAPTPHPLPHHFVCVWRSLPYLTSGDQEVGPHGDVLRDVGRRCDLVESRQTSATLGEFRWLSRRTSAPDGMLRAAGTLTSSPSMRSPHTRPHRLPTAREALHVECRGAPACLGVVSRGASLAVALPPPYPRVRVEKLLARSLTQVR